jgi:hypothetical protein
MTAIRVSAAFRNHDVRVHLRRAVLGRRHVAENRDDLDLFVDERRFELARREVEPAEDRARCAADAAERSAADAGFLCKAAQFRHRLVAGGKNQRVGREAFFIREHAVFHGGHSTTGG